MSMKVDEIVRLTYPKEGLVTRTWIMCRHADAVEERLILRDTDSLTHAIYDLEYAGLITVYRRT